MVVSRRTRSNVRRNRRHWRQRSLFHLFLALIVSVLVSSTTYGIAAEGFSISEASAKEAAIAYQPVVATAAPTALPPTETQAPSPTFELPTTLPTALPPTATSEPTQALEPSPVATQPVNEASQSSDGQILYYAQSGDWLPAVAARFGVAAEEIYSPEPLPADTLIDAGQLLVIPRRPENTTDSRLILPDSEVVFSPSTVDFNVNDFVQKAGGYLSTYREYLNTTGWASGADVINRVAQENSINPRVLLALLEYKAHWVYGQPSNLAETYYPLGGHDIHQKDLYPQLVWAVTKLSVGYYGWRGGTLTELTYPDGSTQRMAPELNAGSAGLQYFFSQIDNAEELGGDLYSSNGFLTVYNQMFGSPWIEGYDAPPLFPAGLTQPTLTLPFMPGVIWGFTGGPHGAWNREGAMAALDFAPGSLEPGCVKSDTWVVAAASGLVTRSEKGLVVVDLDGDGHEQTGWVMIYLHIATEGRVEAGKFLAAGDLIGHPSCEGGVSTGTHVHVVRKYNGEWILAEGPLSFNLSGWVAHAGEKEYQGWLTKGDEKVTACTCGSFETRIIRSKDEN